jgi:Fe-S-cluster containining protein
MNVVKTYGIEFTSPGISRFYLKHKSDGSCAFLCNYHHKGFCSLQHMKPMACKLWPFKILGKPKYGRAREAEYKYADRNLFIYADPSCKGLTWGSPITNFSKTTLTEFIELALGLRKKQVCSTSKMLFYPRYLKPQKQKMF